MRTTSAGQARDADRMATRPVSPRVALREGVSADCGHKAVEQFFFS